MNFNFECIIVYKEVLGGICSITIFIAKNEPEGCKFKFRIRLFEFHSDDISGKAIKSILPSYKGK